MTPKHDPSAGLGEGGYLTSPPELSSISMDLGLCLTATSGSYKYAYHALKYNRFQLSPGIQKRREIRMSS